VSIPVSPLLNDIPTIEIYDVDHNCHILSSIFPTVNLIIPIPPLSSGELPTDITVAALLSTGQVIINGIVHLNSCQRIRVRAVTNGLIYTPIVLPGLLPTIDFSIPRVDTTFAIYKLRNSPIVTINCNN